jgi:ParB family chromosome partitioning protein
MKMQKNSVPNTSEYRNLPLAQLQESPTNPRKRFPEETLKELAASFQSQGILQPLVVREMDADKYEVIAGARRLRAAQLAELQTVPVRVVELSDAAAIETQVVENLQREDIHPLEEAVGFRSLLDLKDPAYTIATIAAKAGKSEAYVQGRIKLTELIPPIAEAFLADRVTIGHALLIAKLPASKLTRPYLPGKRLASSRTSYKSRA